MILCRSAGVVLVGTWTLLGAALVGGSAAEDQAEKQEASAPGPALDSEKFRLRFEVRAGVRTSKNVALRTRFPFPPARSAVRAAPGRRAARAWPSPAATCKFRRRPA